MSLDQEDLALGISFGSINTGLPKDIVKQIIAAEKIPLKKMEGRKEKFSDKKGLVSSLTEKVEKVRGFLTANNNARALRELKIQTDENRIGVTADKNVARPGAYQIEVMQLAQKSSAMSSGFEDPDESYIGVGFIQYNLANGDSKEIYVDQDHSSINGLAKLINKDTKNGLNANVINDGADTDTPWRLIISHDETGDKNLAEFPYFYFIDGDQDFYLEFEREAHDAKIKLDGFELELPDNKTDTLIKGLTIDLRKAQVGEEFSLIITENSEAVTAKALDLVDNLNEIFKFIKSQNTMDENTDTSRTLGGDIMLQSLQSRLRTAAFKEIQTSSGMKRISDIGITFQRDGLMKVDEEMFNNKVKANYQMVTEVLTGSFDKEGIKHKGFINNLDDTIKTMLRYPDGLLQSRKSSLNNKIDAIDSRIRNKQRLIKQKETNLKNKFARLEETIAKLKNQGAGVAALGGGGGMNPVQQLG